MKAYSFLLALLLLPLLTTAQEIIELPANNDTDLAWQGQAQEFFYDGWKTEVVINVSTASMEVFLPDPAIANGTSVIIAPGGGLLALAIEKEGNKVAQWLNKKGVAAFVLKYRLLPLVKEGLDEVPQGEDLVIDMVESVLPLSIADGMNALTYVRENANRWDLDPKKIGFMGFSAGGAVTLGVAFNMQEGDGPDFVVPVYPWLRVMGEYELPEELPQMHLICASDDPLLIAPYSVDLYKKWIDEGGRAEMHMYSKGGHGFGMEEQGLPSDKWIDQFYSWAITEGMIISRNPQ